MSGKVAIIGAGLVGRAWAIVFARAGHPVGLYDPDAAALARAETLLAATLAELEGQRLIGAAAPIRDRIQPGTDLAGTLAGAVLVQESAPEDVAVKRALFAELDRLADAGAILASSSSAIMASRFTEPLAGRRRCLVAHPVNPPALVPIVELAPAPWTDPEIVTRARALYEAAGMAPITVAREVEGFIVNRLQVAVLNEAFKLVADGCVSAGDLDKAMKDGLGLRWSFMGPLETIDLNAPGGIRDYIRRFGPAYLRIAREQAEWRDWDEGMIDMLEAGRREVLGADRLAERQNWRDRRLMALIAHRRAAEREIGE